MTAAGARWLDGLEAVADRFEHVLLDQWGVLHDGRQVHPAARDCVAALQRAGKGVIVLSNSGKRADANADRLAELGLPRALYTALISSGEATWQALSRRDVAPFDTLGRRCWLVVRGGDRSLVDGLDLDLVDGPEDADFVLLGGLDEKLADIALWRPRLAVAAARGLPLICANPDLKAVTPAGLMPAPGALARLYERQGGQVTWLGKPHPPIYRRCLAMLGDPPPSAVLAIGDSLEHDILGGHRAGTATLLVTTGVHAAVFDAAASREAAMEALVGAAPYPDFVMERLAWRAA
ncbi:MAG: TIGR01459 family HAD-type hydrolase [Dongiaceae bacterium]